MLLKSLCQQRTKKEVIPTQMTDLFVRKRLASSENKNVDKIPREEVRMKDLSTFDLRIECHWTILRLESRYKKEVVTKRMADLFVRKRLASSENKKFDKIACEEARMKDLSAFGPRIESYKQVNWDVSNFFMRSK